MLRSTGEKQVFAYNSQSRGQNSSYHPNHESVLVVEPLLQSIKALLDATDNIVQTPVHIIKAFVHIIKTMIHVIEAFIHVNVVLFTCLFGMRKTLFHPLFNTEEPFGYANGEFLEVFFSDKFLCHSSLPFQRLCGQGLRPWQSLRFDQLKKRYFTAAPTPAAAAPTTAVTIAVAIRTTTLC